MMPETDKWDIEIAKLRSLGLDEADIEDTILFMKEQEAEKAKEVPKEDTRPTIKVNWIPKKSLDVLPNKLYKELTEPDEPKSYKSKYSWAEAVKRYYKHTCQKCGANDPLVAHHIHAYLGEERRNTVENGIVFCTFCKKEYDKMYGYKRRSLATIQEFLLSDPKEKSKTLREILWEKKQTELLKDSNL
jgi:Ni,Fe-hydrogenase I large subunit